MGLGMFWYYIGRELGNLSLIYKMMKICEKIILHYFIDEALVTKLEAIGKSEHAYA